MNAQGMTLKQMQRYQFDAAIEAYCKALETGKNLVRASLRVHAAIYSKRTRRIVNRMFKETRRA